MGLFKFLKSLRTLANNRNITIEEAYKFAKQEFGEVSDLLKLQINKIFKDVEAPSIKLPKKPEGKVIEAVFKPGVDKRGKRVEQSPSQAEGTIMDRLSAAANRLEELMKEREAMYKPQQGLKLSEGLTRALARKILDRKRIQIPKGQDPINVFTDIFGESIGDVKNLADEMVEIDQAGGGMKNMDEMLESEGLYDIEIPENPQRGLTKEEIKEKDPDLYDLLYKDDPEDFAVGGRVGFQKGTSKIFDQLEMNVPHPYGHRVEYGAGGGVKALIKLINKKFGKGTVKLAKDIKKPESAKMREAFLEFKKRHNFAYGSGLKLVQVLKKLGKDLKKEIKKAVNDLIPSGDPKLDADMAVDNMLEDLNIDREAIDQYDILDAYGLAYDEIKQPLLKQLKNKPKPFPEIKDPTFDENLPFDNDAEKLAEIKMSNEAYDLETNAPDDLIAELKSIGLNKNAERLELKRKYPGIDDKLLTQIIDDPDPQRKAEVLATIDQAFELMRQGKSQEEVLDIMKQMTDRTKQAGGGLAYLMGL